MSQTAKNSVRSYLAHRASVQRVVFVDVNAVKVALVEQELQKRIFDAEKYNLDLKLKLLEKNLKAFGEMEPTELVLENLQVAEMQFSNLQLQLRSMDMRQAAFELAGQVQALQRQKQQNQATGFQQEQLQSELDLIREQIEHFKQKKEYYQQQLMQQAQQQQTKAGNQQELDLIQIQMRKAIADNEVLKQQYYQAIRQNTLQRSVYNSKHVGQLRLEMSEQLKSRRATFLPKTCPERVASIAPKDEDYDIPSGGAIKFELDQFGVVVPVKVLGNNSADDESLQEPTHEFHDRQAVAQPREGSIIKPISKTMSQGEKLLQLNVQKSQSYCTKNEDDLQKKFVESEQELQSFSERAEMHGAETTAAELKLSQGGDVQPEQEQKNNSVIRQALKESAAISDFDESIAKSLQAIVASAKHAEKEDGGFDDDEFDEPEKNDDDFD